MKKVILVGYMGSGKSLIGQLLSEKMNLSFYDLDNIIEKNQNCSIKTIFETKGEIYFRKLEHKIFKELVTQNNDFVISTGGGTICYANNHDFLNLDGISSVYLNASIQTLYDRLIIEKDKRPLIANKNHEEIMEFIAKHLFERSFFYNQCAIKINVNNKSTTSIIDEIVAILA